MDEDGVQVAIIGTVAWIIAAVVLWLRGDAVADWWLWTALVGVLIGIVGLAYCLRRRSRRRR